MKNEQIGEVDDVPCEFTLNDLFDLYFPPYLECNGYMCMVFQTFLDASGHKDAKLMVSAGFCGNKDVWGDFRNDWKAVLRRHRLEYFESSECHHVNGQFRRLRKGKYAQPEEKEEARGIRDEFLAVVGRHPGIVGLGVAVEMEPYERMAQLPGAKDVLPLDPYKAALCSVMFETVKRVRSRDRNCMVAFVHDDGDCFDGLRSCYREFRRLNPKTARFMGGFAPADDKKIVEVQLADLIANHTAFVGSQHPDARLGILEMRKNIAFLARWDELYIGAVLKYGLRKRGEPIPLGLE